MQEKTQKQIYDFIISENIWVFFLIISIQVFL